MARHLMEIGVAMLTVLALLSARRTALGEESRFAATNSRSQYVHWIDLYDADGGKIDPEAPDARPYSPVHTCGRCHDYAAIAQGYHFNAPSSTASKGRAGEPWIWTDPRTGTQIPLSYRRWQGTYHPRDLGITDREFVLKFGRQMPGGGVGEAAPAPSKNPRPKQRAKRLPSRRQIRPPTPLPPHRKTRPPGAGDCRGNCRSIA